jgi:hypothetical protein
MENSYECYFDHVTRVEPYAMAIQFPSYPKNLTSFSKVKQSPMKVFVGKFCSCNLQVFWLYIIFG